jgi:hypothetical protein
LKTFFAFFPIDYENLQKPFSVKGSQGNEKTGELQKKRSNKEMAEINHVRVFFFFLKISAFFFFFYSKKRKKTGIFET